MACSFLAVAAVTERIELMVAVRPNFHHPALFAKQAANIDRIPGGRLSLNVVSSWWADEAKKYGVHFEQHDDRYARTTEWLDVVDGAWREPSFSYHGRFYNHDDIVLEPKPVSTPERPRPIRIGDNQRALAASASLQERGFLVGAIRPPTVPAGSARLRVTLSADHTSEQVEALVALLGRACARVRNGGT